MLKIAAFCVFCLFVLSCTTLRAQEIQAEKIPTFDFQKCLRPASNRVQVTSTQRSFGIDKAELKTIFDLHNANLVLANFPISASSDATLNLHLEHTWTASDIKVERATRKGMRIPAVLPTQQFYTGTFANDKTTKVNLSFCNGEIMCSITNADGSLYDLCPTGLPDAISADHVLSLVDVSQYSKFVCGTKVDVSPAILAAEKEAMRNTVLSTDLRDVEVAVDIDAQLCKQFGGDYNMTIAYALAVLSSASQIYVKEINVQILPTYIHYWEVGYIDNDTLAAHYPYNFSEIGSPLLTNYGNYWNQAFSDVQRDMAVLMFASQRSATVPSTAVLGIAHRQSLCKQGSAYAVLGEFQVDRYPKYTYSYDTQIATHEMGHVLGCPHTHSCDGQNWFSPPLDTCVTRDDAQNPVSDACFALPQVPVPAPGTIMSYCQILNGKVEMTFGAVMAQKLRANIESAAGNCIKASTTGTIVLTNPLGNQTLQANTTTTIAWHSSGVNTVNVEYSLDSMKSWQRIATSISAALDSVQWTTPNLSSTLSFVRVLSTANPDIGDTSWTLLNIRPRGIVLFLPNGGDRIALGTTQIINWHVYFLSSKAVKVQYRMDQKAWNTIVDSTSDVYIYWNIPDSLKPSNDVEVRVVSLLSDSIIAQSGPFAIGKMDFEFLNLKKNEKLCVGQNYTINYTGDFLPYFTLRYSTDGGATFPVDQSTEETVITQAQGPGPVSWTIPDIQSKTMVVGMFGYVFDDTPLYVSNVFEIDTCTVLGVDDVVQNRFSITNLYLSQIENCLFFDLNTQGGGTSAQVNIEVYDLYGNRVRSQQQSVNSGTQKITLPMKNMASGSYFLRASSQTRMATQHFVVVR